MCFAANFLTTQCLCCTEMATFVGLKLQGMVSALPNCNLLSYRIFPHLLIIHNRRGEFVGRTVAEVHVGDLDRRSTHAFAGCWKYMPKPGVWC